MAGQGQGIGTRWQDTSIVYNVPIHCYIINPGRAILTGTVCCQNFNMGLPQSAIHVILWVNTLLSTLNKQTYFILLSTTWATPPALMGTLTWRTPFSNLPPSLSPEMTGYPTSYSIARGHKMSYMPLPPSPLQLSHREATYRSLHEVPGRGKHGRLRSIGLGYVGRDWWIWGGVELMELSGFLLTLRGGPQVVCVAGRRWVLLQLWGLVWE